MTETNIPEITTTPDNNNLETTTNYINALNELRANTVSKEQYEKVVAENGELVKALVNGETPQTSTPKEKADIPAMRQKLYGGGDISNLDYWKTTLELRDAVIEQEGYDPFLPKGTKIAATAEDVQKANHVAEVIRDCINYADGDSRLFTQELNRRTVDVAPTRRPGRR